MKALPVHQTPGGDDALARLRKRLCTRGLRLMLDFVPNHMAPDHPWIDEHPDLQPAMIGSQLRPDGHEPAIPRDSTWTVPPLAVPCLLHCEDRRDAALTREPREPRNVPATEPCNVARQLSAARLSCRSAGGPPPRSRREGVRGCSETGSRRWSWLPTRRRVLEGAGRIRPDVAVVDLSLARDSGLGLVASAAAALSRPQGDRAERPRRAAVRRRRWKPAARRRRAQAGDARPTCWPPSEPCPAVSPKRRKEGEEPGRAAGPARPMNGGSQ